MLNPRPLFLLVALSFVFAHAQADSNKQVVGAVEVVQVGDKGLSFRARVDTGAKTTSIHAEKVKIQSAGDPKGKPISFVIVNEKGESEKIETRVDSVAKVKTSEKAEKRYKVPLLITWNNTKKSILVTLNDRTEMKYRLLLGRNWLQGDFVVDVDKNSDD